MEASRHFRKTGTCRDVRCVHVGNLNLILCEDEDRNLKLHSVRLGRCLKAQRAFVYTHISSWHHGLLCIACHLVCDSVALSAPILLSADCVYDSVALSAPMLLSADCV